jgi:hypothetical protein
MKYVVKYQKPRGKWQIHGGMFSDKSNAYAQADWYESRGYRVKILQITIEDD